MPAADAALGRLLNPAADALVAEIDAAGWPRQALLEELASFASEYDSNRELVTRAVARLHLPPRDPALLVRLAGAIGDLERVLQQAQPNLAEELALRCGPLREQWEARGPGLLREVARLTEPEAVPAAAEIVLVSPYVGGHGVAHPGQNRVTFEGVLFHPTPALPEPVRLAWLLAQLSADLPRYAELLPAGRAAATFALAMLPATLAAAESVELVASEETNLAMALEVWGMAALLPGDAATTLGDWWSVWLDQPVRWPVAVAALDRLLASG